MLFSIIVTIDNEYEITNNFIENLLANTSLDDGEIIIAVDGCNYASTLQYLRDVSKNNKKIVIIEMDTKNGYGIANNIAIKHSSGDYLVLINSDVLVVKKSIETLVEYVKNNPDVGAAQGLLIYPQNNLVQSTGHLFLDNHNAHIYKNKRLGASILKTAHDRQALTTAFCVITRKEFEKHGGFDPFYYNAYEGIELTLKISLSGKKCMFYPKAIAYHVTGVSRRKIPHDDKLPGIYFWSKWKNMIKNDLDKYTKVQIIPKMLERIYFCIMCTHLYDEKDIAYKLGFDISGIIKIKNTNAFKIDLYTTLPYSAIKYSGPYIFMTSNIETLFGNRNWTIVRDNKDDLVIDAHGNLEYLNIITGAI